MLTTTMMRIKSNVEEAGVTLPVLAKLAGVSASSLSAALRDVAYVGHVKESELLTLTTRIVKYRNAISPLSLPTNWEVLKQLLDSPVPLEQVSEMIAQIFQPSF